jgi:hypothetical protein
MCKIKIKKVFFFLSAIQNRNMATFCRPNVGYFNVKSSVTQSNHWTSKVKDLLEMLTIPGSAAKRDFCLFPEPCSVLLNLTTHVNELL